MRESKQIPIDLSNKCTRQHVPWIGGPGTCLPFLVESFLAWSLALSFLSVSGYIYFKYTVLERFRWVTHENTGDNYSSSDRVFGAVFRIRTVGNLLLNILLPISDPDDKHGKETVSLASKATSTHSGSMSALATMPCWLPLMTCTRQEVESTSVADRYRQLVQLLHMYHKNGKDYSEQPLESPCLSDDELISLVRKHSILRRLVSLAMRPVDSCTGLRPMADATTTESSTFQAHTTPLGQQLVRIWGRLLELPKRIRKGESYDFELSLIVPCYRESGHHVCQKLQSALASCQNPDRIQVVVVDAGGCQDLSLQVLQRPYNDKRKWGQIKIVSFLSSDNPGTASTTSSGRGPCLNFGAQHATGKILSFCHSDTVLPHHWDTKILDTLLRKSQDSVCSNVCAFRFGIDTSSQGLSGKCAPPGIKAVEVTANLRCRLWSLPYGDQCLSIPAAVFDYVGGFPYQPLMEDYELVSFFRKRCALLVKFRSSTTTNVPACLPDEQVSVISGDPVQCSPRRWQRYGVLYVTLLNSWIVSRYECGQLSSHDVYQLYYGKSLPTAKSPWEVELERLLVSFK